MEWPGPFDLYEHKAAVKCNSNYQNTRSVTSPLFINETPYYGYRNPDYKPKTVWRSSQINNSNPYTCKTVSSWWTGVLVVLDTMRSLKSSPLFHRDIKIIWASWFNILYKWIMVLDKQFFPFWYIYIINTNGIKSNCKKAYSYHMKIVDVWLINITCISNYFSIQIFIWCQTQLIILNAYINH